MAFVPGFEHDIFVSYAHVDDVPLLGVEIGWVTTLVENLKRCLPPFLHRTHDFSLWYDHELARHVTITPEILDTLEKSATLLVILSHGYLESEWCRRECDAFWQKVKDRPEAKTNVFIVELQSVPLNERPRALSDRLPHKFWSVPVGSKEPRVLGYPTPVPKQDQEYYNKLEDLARELGEELLRLRNKAETPGAAGASQPSETTDEANSHLTVYLADPTDDLDLRWDEVKRYLEQVGVRVLPEVLYPREETEFLKSVERDLKQSLLFAQLLSDVPGKKPDPSSGTFASLQHRLAKEAGMPILQWRDPSLSVESVADAEQQALLGGETVLAVDLETFKQQLHERAMSEKKKREKPKVGDAAGPEPFVFVDADKDDRDIADALCNILEQSGCCWAQPIHEGVRDPKRVRQDLESYMLLCDGLIVVYGGISYWWVREQLAQWRKMTYLRERRPKAEAVYEGPPPESKQPLGFGSPNMHVIDCRHGLCQDKLQSFLDALKC